MFQKELNCLYPSGRFPGTIPKIKHNFLSGYISEGVSYSTVIEAGSSVDCY